MSEEENIAIETLKEVASDEFDTLGDDISPKMAQNILNVISSQRKEIEDLKEKNKKQSIAIIEYQDLLEKSVSEDKIRKKLKKLRREENKIYKLDYELEPEKAIDCLLLRIGDLEELLEEE